jgi:hypothetical protein
MNRKQVAALVGVAPYAFESGKLKGDGLYLGWSSACAASALHGSDERQQLESSVQDVPRSALGERKEAEGRNRGSDA